MGATFQVLLMLSGAGNITSVGFEHWADGQSVVGDSPGTMQYWADGAPVAVDEV